MPFSPSQVTTDQLAPGTASEIGRRMAQDGGGSVALTNHLLDRIETQVTPIFLAATRDRALAEAQAADARLAAGRPLSSLDGVPVAWKDLVDLSGERTTVASNLFRDAPPASADAPVVANAARAGMVTLGKLNMAEFAYSALGQNPHFGTPLNPNSDEPHAPGGSSSGSGVAVAARLVPAALGSDTAGSVRIPASYCGVVGLKTSEGHIPTAGCFPLSRTQDTLGPLAQSVEDCAHLYEIFRGTPDCKLRAADLTQMSVVVPDGIVTDNLAPAVASAFEASLLRLASAGVQIRHMSMPAFGIAADMLNDLGSIVAAEAFFDHRGTMDGLAAEKMDQRVRARIEIGRSMSAADLVALWRQRVLGMAEIEAQLDGAFVAMPTTAGTAPPMAEFEDDDEAFKRLNLRANRNTSLGSIYNLPGLAIPNGRDAAGLPTSFLLSACGGDDRRLLRFGVAAESIIRNEIDNNNERNWR